MAADIYRRLQQQLDQYSMGFPQTASGIEIRILQYLFTEQAAQVFSRLTPMLETARAVSTRTGQPEEAVAAQLEGMADKGLLFCLKKGGDMTGCGPCTPGLWDGSATTTRKMD